MQPTSQTRSDRAPQFSEMIHQTADHSFQERPVQQGEYDQGLSHSLRLS